MKTEYEPKLRNFVFTGTPEELFYLNMLVHTLMSGWVTLDSVTSGENEDGTVHLEASIYPKQGSTSLSDEWYQKAAEAEEKSFKNNPNASITAGLPLKRRKGRRI